MRNIVELKPKWKEQRRKGKISCWKKNCGIEMELFTKLCFYVVLMVSRMFFFFKYFAEIGKFGKFFRKFGKYGKLLKMLGALENLEKFGNFWEIFLEMSESFEKFGKFWFVKYKPASMPCLIHQQFHYARNTSNFCHFPFI